MHSDVCPVVTAAARALTHAGGHARLDNGIPGRESSPAVSRPGLPGRQELRRMSLTDLLVWGVILGGFAAVATTVVWLTL